MAALYQNLPKTWDPPTISPTCADEVKYGVAARGETLIGQNIREIVTVNGIRVTVDDGTWGLVRASSNKPELVVVVESPASEAQMHTMFEAIDTIRRKNHEVGDYNQTI